MAQGKGFLRRFNHAEACPQHIAGGDDADHFARVDHRHAADLFASINRAASSTEVCESTVITGAFITASTFVDLR
jgi:hypothetical protein